MTLKAFATACVAMSLTSIASGVALADPFPPGAQAENVKQIGFSALGSRFGGFKIPYFVLESSHGRICVPTIDIAARLSLGDIEPLVHIVIAKRDAQGHRDLRGPLPILAGFTGPDGPGPKSSRLLVLFLSTHGSCLPGYCSVRPAV